MLLTDIFAGLSVLSLFILVLHGDGFRRSRNSCCSSSPPSPRRPTAPRSAVLFGLCCVGWIARPLLRAAHCRCRARAGQPDHRRRRRDAAGGQFRAVGTIGLDARRLPASPSGGCCRTASSRAICAITVRKQQFQALPLSQRAAGHRRRFPVGQQHVQQARPLQGHERRDGLHRRCIRSPNIRSGRPRRRIAATARATGRKSRPAKAPTAGSRTPTASSSAISRRRSRRCARRTSSIGTSISRRSTGSMFRSR